ncbi:related to PRS2-Ribose-phosphate pyrophosphokinase [Serendipita indica DSM 11827]|uniref:ribose-phosphate diphosphokinase n=1 Tax=Serendipita indica (strain DSM 11827) TaxID=1109443 RepID=G4TWJ8_SERID|nr:related to PRS2-Ribose-phosphate pyrophosphokinase [Serendipita indica DSM 11827]
MHRGNSIKFMAGNSHPEMAQLIADRLGINMTPTTVKKFSNGETSVRIHESVRDEDVFILQTACGPNCSVDDSLMELLILISACKTASARRITAIIPFFPYSRYSFKDKSRAPITAKFVANMLTVAGCDHVITMDLHASQIQGFFDIPVDNLYSEPIMVGFIKRWIKGWKESVIVSPDAGGAKRASSVASKLGVELAIIHREPAKGNIAERMQVLVGDVSGKIVILLDDMIDTGDTLSLATNTLHENGARAIFVLVSHCTMQPNSSSLKKLSQLPIARLVVTNSLPQTHLMEEVNEETRDTITDSTPVDSPRTTSSKLDSGSSAGSTNGSMNGKLPNGPSPTMGGKLTVLDISPLLAESIRRTHNGESISTLFGGWAERAGMTGSGF